MISLLMHISLYEPSLNIEISFRTLDLAFNQEQFQLALISVQL